MSILLFAGLGIPSFLSLFVYLIVFLLAVFLFYFVINHFPGIPQEVRGVLNLILVVVAVIVLILFLLSLVGAFRL